MDIWLPPHQITDVQSLVQDVYPPHSRKLDDSIYTHGSDYSRGFISATDVPNVIGSFEHLDLWTEMTKAQSL